MSDAKYIIKSSYAGVDTTDGDGVDDGIVDCAGDEEDEPRFQKKYPTDKKAIYITIPLKKSN